MSNANKQPYPYIPRHTPDDGAESWREDLPYLARLRETTLSEALSAEGAGDLAKNAVRFALTASLFPDEQAALYQAVTQGAGAAHAAILGQRRWFTDEVDVSTIRIAQPGMGARSFPAEDASLSWYDWLNGVSLALIARDRAAVNTLAVPTSIEACWMPPERIDPFWQAYCAAVAAALVEPDAAAQWIGIAESALGEARIAPPELIRLVYRPILPVLTALARRDAAAFNAALFEAAQNFHQYYAQPEESGNWFGFFSLPLNGLCVAASDAGLPIEVESGYLLKDLIAGSFPRELTIVTLYYPLHTIAHADEARWFLDLEGVPRANRQHTIVERDDQLLARYEVKDAPGYSHAIAEFILPPSSAAAKPALDVGELLYLAEIYGSVAASDAEEEHANLLDAVRCTELALERLPAAGEAAQFNARRGREVYEAEPGRFDRERLTAYLNSLKQSFARRDEKDTNPQEAPKLSEDEAHVGALAMIEVLRAQVMPLLGALARDAKGQIVAQIKPRDEDYTRVFVGEAAAVAREAYSTLWMQEPPRTAQFKSVEVRCSIAPAGMLADENDLSRPFPQGYRAIAKWLQPQRIWVAWKYLTPGEQSGEAYNGLVWVDDHWAWFPKPFRVLRSLVER